MTRPSIDQQITFLYTKDISKSAVFYEDIMQLPLVLDQGGCRIYGVTDTEPKGIIFTLVVSDVDGWYSHMRDQGVLFEKPPAVNNAYGIYHCFAKDPNGYLIEIQRFLDTDWNK